MPKLGVYADAHFSLNSSVVLGNKNSLSGRLYYLIESFEWMYNLFRESKVDAIIDLGDLADSYNLRAEEITAISKALSYNQDIPEIHILGNHERLSETGEINSVEFLENIPNHRLIKKVTQEDLFGTEVTYIPYGIYEDGFLDEYDKTKLAFSHIDIFGADTGGWILKSGLSPQYLETRFGIVINGHIHNGSWVTDRILNLGALSGQNFSSKIINWKPSVLVFDTDNLTSAHLYENPYSLNFYTLNIKTIRDLINFSKNLEGERNVVQVRVPLSLVPEVRDYIDKDKSILSSRINIESEDQSLTELEYDEIDKLTSVEGGFKKLIDFIESSDDLPYNKKDIIKVISELEANKLT